MGQGNDVEETNTAINAYITRALLEASLALTKEEKRSICLVKLSMNIDLEDAFSFKNALAFLHTQTAMSPLIHQGDGVFLIMLHETKIHYAKTLLSNIKRDIHTRYPALIDAIGITLLDAEDSVGSVLKRVDAHYALSRISTQKKVFCGTKAFNYYENKHGQEALIPIFRTHPTLKLYNLYKGLPVSENATIIAYSEGKLIIEVEKAKLPFYQNESFTHLQHDLIPNALRATIAKVDTKASLLVLNRLEFLETSALERSGVRVEPERKIYASALHAQKRVCEGELGAISEGSIVIKTTQAQIGRLLQAGVGNDFLEVTLQLPTQKNLITTIKTKASVFNVIDEKIILTLHLSPVAKTKVRSYLAMQTESLISGFKKTLKKG
ncbi:hypothetical protein JWV37_00150 [Sulfurospirillum sp. T05]|uniref:GGDEF domain-containing protein n=1 Tax=Sulfurospirillum tamanense TaxID=2813362 RepID=A0ABS2WNE0_9BACT|nr:hypothetical protein [Sulfurospirillum tamanensis]MBN2963177.1 hypothetical protein [Sulfurospirillum tamanensis]